MVSLLGVWIVTNEFDVGVLYQEDVPSDIITDFQSELQSAGLTVEFTERPIGIYAALEWTIPTLVAAYLAKPYFEAFLSEAGKDHYAVAKGAMVKVINKLFGSGSSGPTKRISFLFSIQTQTTSNESVKFVFAEGLEQDQYEAILSAVDELMVDHFSSSDGGRLSKLVQDVGGNSRSHYLEYSFDQDQWVAIDTLAEVRKQRERQSD